MIRIINANVLDALPTLDNASVHCCVTSPPYWGLRDYGVDGQLGLEATPEEYVAKMVDVFREVWSVLRDDGTLWLNIGDSYHNVRTHMNGGCVTNTVHRGGSRDGTECFGRSNRNKKLNGLKEKDLVGIPWRVAFALQADGWYLRQDIIWHKPNPMPESVRDRCTKAHEYIFLLAKSERYYYDSEEIREIGAEPQRKRNDRIGGANGHSVRHSPGGIMGASETRNRRSVWTVTTKPYSEAHFATFPPDLIEPCILAGCPEGGTVLDPFLGSGTTAQVCNWNRRNCIGIELNPEYVKLAEVRAVTPRVVEKRHYDTPGQLSLFRETEATA